MKKIIFLPLFFALFSLSSCMWMIRPSKSFDAYKHPVAPDYSNPNCWAALPTIKNASDSIPKNSDLKDDQKNAKADVFFIYPTSYFRRKNWNGDVYDKHLNKRTDKESIYHQASVFNGSCRIYAPRYRQATLYSFVDTTKGKQPLDFAYEDVKKAFQYYLDHYNNGRPIIIASHSQGSFHARRLLHDFFENNPNLRKRLVAAYLIGGEVRTDDYANIPPCDSANQIGCTIGWNTLKWGISGTKRVKYSGLLCVNPLTWKRDTAYAGREKNIGGVPISFKRIDKNVCDAECSNGKLWIHNPRKAGYPSLFGYYHIVDYGLFYINIRENVQARIKNYFLETGK
ncbi:MAG: DUF3089 domain-containing protein [Bacteroidia bacterium]